MLVFSTNAMKAVLDNKTALTVYLPKIVWNRLLDKRLTQVSVGPDKLDCLEDGMEALGACCQTCIDASRLKVASNVPKSFGMDDALMGLGLTGTQHHPSQSKAVVGASAKTHWGKERLATMKAMFTHQKHDNKVLPPDIG